ncbi:TPA: hypothetical protein ACX6PV_000864 [Photobacterium damselae]
MCVRMALARENMTAKELGDCIGVSLVGGKDIEAFKMVGDFLKYIWDKL